ncbi:MAG: tRNA (adenosine(37)-N6)-threonylcarbamoyltransferase complex dimerization subunit type 1 TsaB [Anaerolineales bacterium]
MILAVDTATRRVGLALADENEILAEHYWRTADNHTRELAPAVARALRRADVQPAQLRAVAVAIGPGSFTGLRIGLGFAKGIALAHNIALVGVPTLDIVAQAQPAFDGTLIAALQSGRGRIAAGRYQWQAGWHALAPAEITTWEAVVENLPGEPVYICGEIDAAGRKLVQSRAQLAPATLNVRRAGVLAEIGRARFNAGDVDDPATLAPDYLHLPTVTPPRARPASESA